MSLAHFFLDRQVIANETDEVFSLQLAEDDLRHIHALRLHAPEHIAVIDAASDYFEVETVSVDAAGLRVRICGHLETAPVPSVTLVQGIPKADKFETIIRHATELGVCEFVPFESARSIVKLKPEKGHAKVERWQAIAKSAAMQSGQTRIPHIVAPQGIEELRNTLRTFDVVLVFWEESCPEDTIVRALESVPGIVRAAAERARIAVVVGPEGGLCSEEVDQLLACNQNAHPAYLGSSILRTETAGLIAPALVIYELGGLGRGMGGSC